MWHFDFLNAGVQHQKSSSHLQTDIFRWIKVLWSLNKGCTRPAFMMIHFLLEPIQSRMVNHVFEKDITGNLLNGIPFLFWIFFMGQSWHLFLSDSNKGSCSISFFLFNRGTHVIENSGNEADLRQQVLVIYQVGDLLSVTQPLHCWVKKEQGWLF